MLFELQYHVNVYTIEIFLHLRTAYNESNAISMKKKTNIIIIRQLDEFKNHIIVIIIYEH